MAEDWTAIAAEVDAAIRSVGETDEGFPATLRQPGTPTGPAHDPTPGAPTYTTLRIIDSNERLRDRDGTLIDATLRTLTVGTGSGVVPADEDAVAIGITADEVDADTVWHEIKEVRPLAPAGVAVLYEIDLVELMARHPTTRQRLEELMARHEPLLRAAFLAAIEDITSQAQIGRIAELREHGDIEGAIRAVHLDPAAFRAFERAIADAYTGGGTAAVAGLPDLREPDGGRLVIRFDARHPRAEQWLTEHSSTLVTRIIDDQRAAIRSALTEGMTQGVNPRTTALDIVGRINRATGRREGGIIGLTSQQDRFVTNARAELLSGDPERLRAFLERVRRDRRFDRTVLAAIRDGKAIPRDTANRIIWRYSDSLLQALRGETIARTEAIAALNQSRTEAMRQAIDSGSLRQQDVRKVWRATWDSRTRDSHAWLDGQSVGLEERFSNGLMYPGDPAGPASETVNCRCVMITRIDFLANVV